jgi:hypothetical protein
MNFTTHCFNRTSNLIPLMLLGLLSSYAFVAQATYNYIALCNNTDYQITYKVRGLLYKKGSMQRVGGSGVLRPTTDKVVLSPRQTENISYLFDNTKEKLLEIQTDICEVRKKIGEGKFSEPVAFDFYSNTRIKLGKNYLEDDSNSTDGVFIDTEDTTAKYGSQLKLNLSKGFYVGFPELRTLYGLLDVD